MGSKEKFRFIYVAIVLVDMVVLTIPTLENFRILSKPMIVGSILFYMISCSFDKSRIEYFLLMALVFSWCGDVILIFEKFNSLFFIFGLVSFLVAHIFYCLIFKLQGEKDRKKMFFIFPLIAYAMFIYMTLREGLGDMLIPVILYVIVILTMLMLAILRKNTDKAYQLVVIGGILFVISDSVLAVDKFKYSIFLAPQIIMATYAAAQYFIFFGLLRSFRFENP